MNHQSSRQQQPEQPTTDRSVIYNRSSLSVAPPLRADAAASEQVLAGCRTGQRKRHRRRLVSACRVPRDHVVHCDESCGIQENSGKKSAALGREQNRQTCVIGLYGATDPRANRRHAYETTSRLIFAPQHTDRGPGGGESAS